MVKKYCFAYTLAEIVMVMLIIAVIVAVSIKVTKAKLDNIISYTYYSAYNSIRKVTAEMLADFDIKNDDYIMTLFAQPVYADSDDCFYSETAANGTVYCYNYELVDSCQVHNFNCLQHVGEYGITSQMCGVGNGIPYGLYVTKGQLTTSTGVGKVLDKIRDLIPSGQYASIITEDSLCSFYWGTGDWQPLGACHDTDHAQQCGWGAVSVFLSSEVKEPEPEPPACELPFETEKEIQYCRGKEFDAITCGWKNIIPFPPSCSDGYQWNNAPIDCKCIPTPRTVPRKGVNFCKLFAAYSNTRSGTIDCNGDAISQGTNDFSTLAPDLTLRNGIRFYNVRQNPLPLSELNNNIQGGSYEGVDNINSWGYTIYADVDGVKGGSTLWEDIFPFYVTLSGRVIPVYKDELGGNSTRHLAVSVENETYNEDGKRVIKWLSKSVSFKEGACAAGYVGPLTPYCANQPKLCLSGTCTVKAIAPVKFFF
ncbi:MAG TPA: hypothetical protein IAD11_11100 [Candidatus Stercorousia faecigallinarum]|nr:hypothetical protein [Candidatus Stercorousia faecigallinarum]